MGPESPKVLIHICIELEAQTEVEDLSEDKHAVSQRAIVVSKEDSVNRNSPGNYVEDENFLD